MDTSKNKTKMTEEKRKLRNSPALFEFYRSLTGLHVVLVEYVHDHKHFKEEEANKEVEGYGAKLTGLDERAAKVTEDLQNLMRQYQNGTGCGPGETWDPATRTCG